MAKNNSNKKKLFASNNTLIFKTLQSLLKDISSYVYHSPPPVNKTHVALVHYKNRLVDDLCARYDITRREAMLIVNIYFNRGKLFGENGSAVVESNEEEIAKAVIELMFEDKEPSLSSAHSRLAYNIAKYLKLILEEQNIMQQDEESKVIEIKYKTLKLKYKNLWEKLVHYDTIIQSLRESLKVYEPPVHKANIKSNAKNKKANKNDGDKLILLVSDAHIGEEVSMDFYTYNIQVAWEYANKIVDETVANTTDNMDTIFLFYLGDMVSGIIHEELVIYSINIAEQVVNAAHIMAYIANEVQQRTKLPVVVFGVVGNHGRIFKKKNYKEKYNSFDYLAYKLAQIMNERNPNINWHIPKSPYAIVQIGDHNFLLHHGDNIKSWMGIPFYGITRTTNTYTATFLKYMDKKIHYYVMGHFHVASSLPAPFGSTFINGTWKLVDEYSLEKGYYSTEAKQLLLHYNKDEGVKRITNILLAK